MIQHHDLGTDITFVDFQDAITNSVDFHLDRFGTLHNLVRDGRCNELLDVCLRGLVVHVIMPAKCPNFARQSGEKPLEFISVS